MTEDARRRRHGERVATAVAWVWRAGAQALTNALGGAEGTRVIVLSARRPLVCQT